MIKEILDFKYLDKGKDQFNNLRHTHGESYEILLVRTGSGTITVRDRLFPIKAGALYLINGADTHCSAPENPDEYTREKLIIRSGVIDKIAALTGCEETLDKLFHKDGGSCVLPDEKTAESIDAEFSRIRRAIADDSPCALVNVTSAVFNIITAAVSGGSPHAPLPDNRISEALDYINQNISRAVSLDEICDHIHVSKYYLCRVFKKTVGMTVFEYVLSRRLSIARKNLLRSSAPLSEIANEAGFSSLSYFGKTFRELEGMSPSEFRKAGLSD